MATYNERQADVSDFLQEAVNKETRESAILIDQMLVTSSAVRDGFLRGSFIASVGAPSSELPNTPDESGNSTISKAISKIGQAINIKYPTIYIQNNQPYAYRIMEDGYSENTPDKQMSIIIQRVVNR